MKFNTLLNTFKVIAAGILISAALPSNALLFIENKINNKKILLLIDCSSKIKKGCTKNESYISQGDSSKLQKMLSKNTYYEIWLNSGGGDLMEGVKLGRILASKKATVRVPDGANCISACTVAFLGGLFRYVDTNATYQVHSYSRVLNGISEKMEYELLRSPKSATNQLITKNYISARNWVPILAMHFQSSIRGKPSPVYYAEWENARAITPNIYSKKELNQIVQRIKTEKNTAIQQILMEIERKTMIHAINDIRKIEKHLGPRADHALDMLEIMFNTRITDTASLSQETLKKMGYITTIFN